MRSYDIDSLGTTATTELCGPSLWQTSYGVSMRHGCAFRGDGIAARRHGRLGSMRPSMWREASGLIGPAHATPWVCMDNVIVSVLIVNTYALDGPGRHERL